MARSSSCLFLDLPAVMSPLHMTEDLSLSLHTCHILPRAIPFLLFWGCGL